jgi:cytochrome P450
MVRCSSLVANCDILLISGLKCLGPVVRITPDEIHLADPDNYEKIYHIGSKYSKSPSFYQAFGSNSAAFTTPSNEVHRVRRAALNPLFSRKMVLELEDVVQSKVEKLCQRMNNALAAGKPIDLHHGFRAISVDVITDYAFDNCYNLLDKSDFGVDFFAMVRGLGPSFWFFQQWPSIQHIALKTPKWLAKILSTPLGSFMQMQAVLYLQALARMIAD